MIEVVDIHVTSMFAAIFALLHVIFTMRVGGYRFKSGISLGDGGDKELLARIRAHGNYIEQVPIALLLLLLNELNGLSDTFLLVLGSVLLAARLTHYLMIVSRSLPAVLRPVSMISTLGVILVSGLALVL
ncbi:MAG: MAPEG family protein [Pseudomonadota bacterium]